MVADGAVPSTCVRGSWDAHHCHLSRCATSRTSTRLFGSTYASGPNRLDRADNDALRALEWHSYSFNLPPAATLLAGTTKAVQAFRAGPCAWGFQYHLEADAQLATHWLRVYRDDIGSSIDVREVTDVGGGAGAGGGEHGIALGHAFAGVVVARERQGAQ